MLGVVEVGGPGGQAFVMADIPGLIEGAAGGAGLGHEFLRHVRRTKVLVHVLDAAGGLEGRDPIEDFETINEEIATFDPEMGDKPMFVALNKIDLQEARDNLDRLHAYMAGHGYERVFEISAATGQGVEGVMTAVAAELREIAEREADTKRRDEEAPKRRVYTLGDRDEQAWEVERMSRHHFRVSGIGIERFTRMTNFSVPDSVDRFQRVLDRSGIQAELEAQGIQDGDTVHIADFEMTWGEQDEEGNLISDEAFTKAAFEAEAAELGPDEEDVEES
jgi:GTP-binding protein